MKIFILIFIVCASARIFASEKPSSLIRSYFFENHNTLINVNDEDVMNFNMKKLSGTSLVKDLASICINKGLYVSDNNMGITLEKGDANIRVKHNIFIQTDKMDVENETLLTLVYNIHEFKFMSYQINEGKALFIKDGFLVFGGKNPQITLKNCLVATKITPTNRFLKSTLMDGINKSEVYIDKFFNNTEYDIIYNSKIEGSTSHQIMVRSLNHKWVIEISSKHSLSNAEFTCTLGVGKKYPRIMINSK